MKTLIAVLLFSASMSAQASWVLWEQRDTPTWWGGTARPWSPVSTWTRLDMCQLSAEMFRPYKLKGNPRWVCLPAGTVPRSGT